jgi:HlyD family secretion protein
MKRALIAVAVLVVLLATMAFWPKAIPVDLARVERGPLAVTVEEEGETRVHERFVVSAPAAGRILRIELEPGDRVERGKTVVATLRPADPTPLDARAQAEALAAVKAAQAVLGQAQVEAAHARAEWGRQRGLAADGIVSPEALETAATASRTADLAVSAAEHQLAEARARLIEAGRPRPTASPASSASLALRSPVDGVVLKRLHESEVVVPAGEPLLELGDPAKLEIVSDLLSSDAVKVAPGDAVTIERWGGDREIRGRVRRVEPSGFMKVSALGVEEQRVNVIVDLDDPLDAWKRLGDGYRVEVRIVVWRADDVLKVPVSALSRHGENWVVFCSVGGRARLREVQIGRRNGTQAQVLSGLSDGELVVVHPSDSIADKTRIRRRAVTPESGAQGG